jgi:hypothetical protein
VPDRRHILELLAASSFLALPTACSAAPNTNDSLPDPIAAWRQPGARERDLRRFALAHAILAPNPHNRQPWLISLKDNDKIVLHFDTTRRLPVTDPFDRQLTIGCGAFLELLSIASAQAGYHARIELFPEGQSETALDQRPIATIQLVSGGQKSPLFDSIIKRRSNKEVYDKNKRVTPVTLQDLIAGDWPIGLAFSGVLGEDLTCQALRSLTKRAYRREVETPFALKESVDLMRIGKREIAQYRDGIDLDFPFLNFLVATGQLTREKLMQPGTSVYRQGLENYDPLADSAAGYIWISSAKNDRTSQITVGRAYARLNLRATQLGIAMHPMSQALQEYTEMADIKQEMDALLMIGPDKRLQMLARIGYGPNVPPAPRRGLSENIVE